MCVCVRVRVRVCGEAICSSDSQNYVEEHLFHHMKWSVWRYTHFLWVLIPIIATVSAPTFYRPTLPIWTWSWWCYAYTRNCRQPYNLFTSTETSGEFSLLCKKWEHNCCKPYSYSTVLYIEQWHCPDEMCHNYMYSSVVVIDLKYDILNYNYLGLKPQLLPITITQILGQ